MQKTSTVNGFFKALLRYLNTTFGNDVVTFYSNDNAFYILTHKLDMSEFTNNVLKLNNNKKFNGIILYFSVGFITASRTDSFDSIILECNNANFKASKQVKEDNSITIFIG